jgi:hypothetical protein
VSAQHVVLGGCDALSRSGGRQAMALAIQLKCFSALGTQFPELIVCQPLIPSPFVSRQNMVSPEIAK